MLCSNVERLNARANVPGPFKDVQDTVSRTRVRNSASGGQRQHHAEIHTVPEAAVLRVLGISRSLDVGFTKTRVRDGETALRGGGCQSSSRNNVLQYGPDIHPELFNVVRDGNKYVRLVGREG